MQRRCPEDHAFLAGVLLRGSHCNHYGHLLQMLEVTVGDHYIDIGGKPVARCRSHARNLTQLIAEGFFGLTVDPALANPETNSRCNGKHQYHGSKNLGGQLEICKHGSFPWKKLS